MDIVVSILLQDAGHPPCTAVLIALNTAPPFQLRDGGRPDRGWHPSLTALQWANGRPTLIWSYPGRKSKFASHRQVGHEKSHAALWLAMSNGAACWAVPRTNCGNLRLSYFRDIPGGNFAY